MARLSRDMEEIARAHADPALDGHVDLGIGLVHMHMGRWREAVQRLGRAAATFEPLRGYHYEWLHSCVYEVVACYGALDLVHARRVGDALVRHVERTGSPYALSVCAVSPTLVALTDPNGDPSDYLRLADERQPPRPGFTDSHRVSSEIIWANYQGRGATSVALWDTWEPRFRKAHLLMNAVTRSFLPSLSAIGATQAHDVTAVRRATKELARSPIPWARSCSQYFRAWLGLHHRSDDERAIRAFAEAVDALDTTGFGPLVHAARYRLGKLVGGTEGETLVQKSIVDAERCGLHDPVRFLETSAPSPDVPLCPPE